MIKKTFTFLSVALLFVSTAFAADKNEAITAQAQCQAERVAADDMLENAELSQALADAAKLAAEQARGNCTDPELLALGDSVADQAEQVYNMALFDIANGHNDYNEASDREAYGDQAFDDDDWALAIIWYTDGSMNPPRSPATEWYLDAYSDYGLGDGGFESAMYAWGEAESIYNGE